MTLVFLDKRDRRNNFIGINVRYSSTVFVHSPAQELILNTGLSIIAHISDYNKNITSAVFPGRLIVMYNGTDVKNRMYTHIRLCVLPV